MQPVQITYHGIEPSDALTALIRTRAAHLERVSERIHALRVLVDAPRVRRRSPPPDGDASAHARSRARARGRAAEHSKGSLIFVEASGASAVAGAALV